MIRVKGIKELVSQYQMKKLIYNGYLIQQKIL